VMGRSGDGRKVVMPGEEIATSEEFAVGEGTYEREGKILASVTGFVELDNGEMVARVLGLNPPRLLKAGDTILGEVSEVRGTMVNIQSIAPEEAGRRMTGQDMGTIHISKVTDGRSDDLRELFRLGDVVRAKVIQVKPSLQLTTAGPGGAQGVLHQVPLTHGSEKGGADLRQLRACRAQEAGQGIQLADVLRRGLARGWMGCGRGSSTGCARRGY
jgi:exosome complex component CSL4